MKKLAFLLSLALAAGCDSDDDLPLLPTPTADLPAPGELPTQVTVVHFNLKDVICPDTPALNRTGILTHVWGPVTRYEVKSGEVVIEGDVEVTWINTECTSVRIISGAIEEYPRGPLSSDVVITPTPSYFGS